jgi:hypothetical protein
VIFGPEPAASVRMATPLPVFTVWKALVPHQAKAAARAARTARAIHSLATEPFFRGRRGTAVTVMLDPRK